MTTENVFYNEDVNELSPDLLNSFTSDLSLGSSGQKTVLTPFYTYFQPKIYAYILATTMKPQKIF